MEVEDPVVLSEADLERKQRNKKKKDAKKKNKKNSNSINPPQNQNGIQNGELQESDDLKDVEIEFVTQNEFDPSDPGYSEFASIFAKFQFPEAEQAEPEAVPSDEKPAKSSLDSSDSEGEGDEDKKGGEDGKISKKKLRRLKRLGVGDLKQKAKKPEVVEWVDVTASDPLLLVHLKAYRNTVQVPRHWSQKRRYLQSKRGMEKSSFELPDFIKNTGISELREAVREKEENMKMKTKMREKVQPKMGKLEIDYQKLHDAFFKFQKKPHLSVYGDLYYEGKEYEIKVKEKKPGSLSEDLKTALNIPPGAPPPWLINMQRYGPPPSYPNMKIPGLNSPIPDNANWGYHPGGWGKPPVDERGIPLYGDVFGASAPPPPPPENIQPIERAPWGQMEEDVYESEESEAEESEAEEEKDLDLEGLETPSGLSSVASGLETPDRIELRKDIKRGGDETPDISAPKQLFTVLPQRDAKATGFMASGHAYDLSGLSKGKVSGPGVDVALDPSDMENIDNEKLSQLFEQQKAAEKETEDMSDMVAEHAANQSKKRKKPDSKSGGSSSSGSGKKSKDFKF